MKLFNIIDLLVHIGLALTMAYALSEGDITLLAIIYCICLAVWQLFGIYIRLVYTKDNKHPIAKAYLLLLKAFVISIPFVFIPYLGIIVAYQWIAISLIMAFIYVLIMLDSLFFRNLDNRIKL